MKQVLLPVGALVLACALAPAAVLIRLSDAQLVEHARHVVVATVTAVQPSWMDPDADGVSQIYTTIEVRVDQVLHGDARVGDPMSFIQQGGTIGRVQYRIHGMPEFAPGDRALLFLEGNLTACKYSPIVGLAQGRWIVRTDADGRDVARRDFTGCCFANPDGTPAQQDLTPDQGEEPLADLIGRFQQEIARRREAQDGEVAK